MYKCKCQYSHSHVFVSSSKHTLYNNNAMIVLTVSQNYRQIRFFCFNSISINNNKESYHSNIILKQKEHKFKTKRVEQCMLHNTNNNTKPQDLQKKLLPINVQHQNVIVVPIIYFQYLRRLKMVTQKHHHQYPIVRLHNQEDQFTRRHHI